MKAHAFPASKPRDIQWRHRRERREGGGCGRGQERGAGAERKEARRKTQKEEMRVRGGGPWLPRERLRGVCVYEGD